MRVHCIAKIIMTQNANKGKFPKIVLPPTLPANAIPVPMPRETIVASID